MTRFCHVCETHYQRRCHQCQSCFRLSDLSLWINASNTTWQQIWGRYCLVPQGSVVLCCSSSSFGSMWKHFGQQGTHVSGTRPRCHTSCLQPYQNNFTGHKFLLRDNECTVSFSHYGSGTLGGEPASINFQDGLNKGPWWRHLESYYLGLMNFWQRAVWFMIPNTRPRSSSYIDHILLHFCALKMFGLLFALDLLCRVIVFKLNLWYCLEKKKLRLCLNQPHEQDESFPQLIKF